MNFRFGAGVVALGGSESCSVFGEREWFILLNSKE
jgi:hypothetical protein